MSVLVTSGFKAYPGLGVEALVEGRRVIAGSARFLAQEKIDVIEIVDVFGRPATGTCVHVAQDGHHLGTIQLVDAARNEANAVVEGLRQRGMRVVMCSGDRGPAVAAMARRLGITDYVAEVEPAGKLALVRQLRSEGRRVCMVGDGLNDAPALAAADLGLAPANGTEVATLQADGVLVHGDLRGVIRLVDLAKVCRRIIAQNLALGGLYNLLAIPAAAGVFGSGILSPTTAAAAMASSSLAVVANSLRLRWAGGTPTPGLLQRGLAETVRQPPPLRFIKSRRAPKR